MAFAGRYVIGLDLRRIDELLGLDDTGSSRLVPAREMVTRSQALLRAAARHARQLPPGHYDDRIPGMEDVKLPLVLPDGTELRLPDGTPFVPHQTHLGLVRHIVAHAAKFEVIAEHPGTDLSDVGRFAALGEPTDDVAVESLCAELETIATRVARWWETNQGEDLGVTMRTFFGPQTQHQMLQSMLVSLAQHGRQLVAVLRSLDVEPDQPVDAATFDGLQLPTEIWA